MSIGIYKDEKNKGSPGGRYLQILKKDRRRGLVYNLLGENLHYRSLSEECNRIKWGESSAGPKKRRGSLRKKREKV